MHNSTHSRPDCSRVASTADTTEENPLIKFSPSIFFLAFLPPIIFNEGYHLKQQFFFGYIKEVRAQ